MDIIKKTLKVIESCKTQDQLVVAKNFSLRVKARLMVAWYRTELSFALSGMPNPNLSPAYQIKRIDDAMSIACSRVMPY